MPTLMDKHPELKDDFADIMRELKRPASPNKDTGNAIELITGEHAVAITCANCGGTVSRQSPDSVQVICQYCGCDSQNAEPGSLAKWREQLQVNDKFSIGSIFRYGATKWQAIGVQRYRGTIREWDSEDDVWETNPGHYTVWWMINANREIAWLSDFGKKRYWSQKYLPKKPALPAKNDKGIEYGYWILQLAAGEFSYQPQPGEDRHTFEQTRFPKGSVEARKDSAGNRYTYSVEAHIDDNGKATEYEFVRSVGISNRTILQGIGAGDTLKAVKGWSRTGRILLISGVIAGGSYFAWKTVMPAAELFRTSVSLQGINDVPAGELVVSEKGAVYQLSTRLSNGLPTNTWTGVDVDITDSDGEYAGGYYVEFWSESGTDSDGYWSESRLQIAENVRFDETGRYSISATMSGTTAKRPANLDIVVTSNPFPFIPFAIAGGTGILMGLISFTRSSARAASGATLGATMARGKRKNRARGRRKKPARKATGKGS